MPLDHPAFAHLGLDADLSEEGEEQPTDELPVHLKQMRADELVVDGRIVVFTDGASRHNQDHRLRRAG
eukprot:5614898-Karenia_brevis.AAC.1